MPVALVADKAVEDLMVVANIVAEDKVRQKNISSVSKNDEIMRLTH